MKPASKRRKPVLRPLSQCCVLFVADSPALRQDLPNGYKAECSFCNHDLVKAEGKWWRRI